MINDEYILTYFFGKNHKKLNKKLLNDIPNEIIEYLNNRYSDSTCLLETLERIKKHIDVHPICENCGKLVKYVGSTRMYLKSCGCRECELKVNYLHGSNTNLQKYGVDNVAKVEIIKEKIKQTNLNKYGVTCTLQNNIIKEKTKQTCLEKYGTEYAQSYSIVKEKIKNSNINTCIKKYNVNNISKLENTKNKIKETCLNRYGVSNVLKIDKIIQENINKRYNSIKNHNSFVNSKTEEESYILLKEKYIDIIRQYKSELYPFACDFYISELNLYIECNYFWTHGKFPYIESEQKCVDKLNEWKSKNTEFYNNAIKTWIYYDVYKRNIAKQNNLNWLEFFSIQELKDWLEKQ